MMRVFKILFTVVLLMGTLACCSNDDEQDTSNVYMVDKIHEGSWVYEPTLGRGYVYKIYKDNPEWHYFIVVFDGSPIPVNGHENGYVPFGWNGEYWDGKHLFRVQPSKWEYNW